MAHALLALLLSTTSVAEPPRTTVGVNGRLTQQVLPGPELEPKPIAGRKTPVVVRIEEVYRHGDAFRYDFVYQGLEPGEFNLAAFLQPKAGATPVTLPALPIVVESVRPAGIIEPTPLPAAPSPPLAGYRDWVVAGLILWVAGLFDILLVGRRRKVKPIDPEAPVTAADRLKPLVERALTGWLSQAECATLERTLLAYWRRRLDLERCTAAEAMTALRGHDEASRLLERLEGWLHRPRAKAA
ncbi:MAG: hypothetical protein ACRDD1_19525, partial [Planctomycetia bacterium]